MDLIEAFKRTVDLVRSNLILLEYAYVLTGWAEMKNRNTALRGRTMFGNEYVCEEQIPSTLIVMDLKGSRRFRMAETALVDGYEIWKRFLRKHLNNACSN